jgi:hypothetical protein
MGRRHTRLSEIMTTRAETVRDVLRRQSDARLLWALASTIDPVWQRRICLELGRRNSRMATADILRLLEAALVSEEWRVVEAACEALGEMRAEDAGPAMTTLLARTDLPVGVRDTAAFALAKLEYRPATPVLIASLADPNKSVRLCAIAALRAISDPGTATRVEAFIPTESDAEVEGSLRALASHLRGLSGEAPAEWINHLVGNRATSHSGSSYPVRNRLQWASEAIQIDPIGRPGHERPSPPDPSSLNSSDSLPQPQPSWRWPNFDDSPDRSDQRWLASPTSEV